LDQTRLAAIQNQFKDRNYRFTLHAGERMTKRHIAVREVEEAILSPSAEIIEDYPEDPRGASCLIMGATENTRRLHVQCTYSPNVAVITAYEPQTEEWIDWRIRKGGPR
jgi:hypothetical protein